MKILVHSTTGDSAGLVQRFKSEGHKVSWFIKEKSCRSLLDGIIPQVSTMAEGVREKPDFILFDREGDGALADRLKNAGLNVCCACALADKMELDRGFGLDLMKKNGIRIPETKKFKNIQDARDFVKKNPKAYAIKIDGNVSAASSYVSKDEKDMLDYIDYQDEMNLIKGGTSFVLQEVVKGVEISTEVWFSNGDPVQPFNSTFETKKFLPGDLGPNTGCETSAVFPYRPGIPKMVEKTIKKIFPLMKKEGWTGPLDINCIVSEKDHEPYALEWTVRLGYSAIYAFSAILQDNIGEFFKKLAQGTLDRVPVKHSWGTSLKVHIPPYPLELPEDPEAEAGIYENTASQVLKAPTSPNWWPIDVMKDKKGRIVTAGENGIVGECTGVGDTLLKAWTGSKKIFDGVSIANKGGRYIDGIDSPFKRAEKLRSWEYEVTKP